MKHTSTILEPSIPFHILVKLVDAEDIANHRVRTHDLTLELNNITNQSQSQTMEQQPEQHMFTQPNDPNNNKQNLHTKNIAPIVIEQITLFHHVSKNIETMIIKEKSMQDQNLHKNLLCNTSVQTLKIKQKLVTDQMNIITAVEVRHESAKILKIFPHRTDIVIHHEIEIIMTEALLKVMHVPDMLTINETLDPIVLLIDHTDHPTDVILVQDTDHFLIQETTILQNILLHLHLLQDQEILDILDPLLTLIREITLIQYKPNQQMTLLNLKYTCTTLQKWLMP